MSFRLSRPGKTEPADAEPAADAEPDATKPDATKPDATDTDDTLDTPNVQGAKAGAPAPGIVPAQPSFQPKDAAQPGAPAFFTEPPDDALEGPLLPNAAQLRGSWQQVQASFVDDPRDSVAEAAALVDHAAQALAGALQRRQRRLRESWDSASGETADAKSPDTEQLRITMRRYRMLFNRICQP
jgi:hypothetical protein